MAEVEEIRTPSEEDIKAADILKTEANDFFKSKSFFYSKIICNKNMQCTSTVIIIDIT